VPFRTIICAVDLSDASLEALSTAAALARRLEASLHVVHVLDQTCLRPEEDLAVHDQGRLARELRESAEEELGQLLGRAGVAEGALGGVHVRTGEAVDELLDASAELGAELIVVRTHGRRGIDRYLQHSVAEGLLERGGPPVLTLRPAPSPGEADPDA
jgi:nucleotide-binding universal stress UspA family protein